MKKFSLKNRFIVFITGTIVLPSFLINIIVSMVYIRYMTDKTKESYNYISSISYNNAMDTFFMYNRMFDNITNDPDITEILKELNRASDLHSAIALSGKIDSKIQNLIFENDLNENCSITLYPINPDASPIGTYVASLKSASHQDWLDKIGKRNKYIYLNNDDRKKSLGISMYMYDTANFFSSEEIVAVMNMEIDIPLMFNNTVIDRNKLLRIELYNQKNDEVVSFGSSAQINPKNNYCYERNFINNNLKIKYTFNMSEEYSFLHWVVLILIFSVLLLLIVEMLISFHFSANLYRRVSFINDKIRHIQNGRWNYDKTLDGSDEFSIIDDGLSVMSRKIETLINDNFVMEIEKKQAKIMALQMQINPHFLYNTLECINSIAKSNSCGEIALISQKLSDILRYNLRKDKGQTVPLSEEISQANNYFDIQKIRFGDRLNIFYDIPCELRGATVLKFLLQPIIENVIKHVIQKDLESHPVVISAKAEGDILKVSVIDDGADTCDTSPEQIFSKADGKKNSGIGLKNINSRLKLVFGEEYGISFNSIKNIGTEVTATMPLIIGEKNVQCIDS